MPVQIKRDSRGCFARWGEQGHKYYYECGNALSRSQAKEKARLQGVAIGEFAEESYTDYPQQATENAKIALRWAEKNGWGSCGTAVGKARANQLEPISRDKHVYCSSRFASSKLKCWHINTGG